jgi:hypothetical protein
VIFISWVDRRSLLRRELFPDLLESVIPECCIPSISLGTVRFSNRRESRRDPELDPRLKHSGVTPFLIPCQLLRGSSFLERHVRLGAGPRLPLQRVVFTSVAGPGIEHVNDGLEFRFEFRNRALKHAF